MHATHWLCTARNSIPVHVDSSHGLLTGHSVVNPCGVVFVTMWCLCFSECSLDRGITACQLTPSAAQPWGSSSSKVDSCSARALCALRWGRN